MDSVTPEMRRNAKTLNFGLMYGMGAFSLAKDLGIGRGQAKEFIDNYFAVYAGVKAFFDENVRHAEETGYIKTIFDRRRKILAINSKNKMEKEGAIRVAKNSPIQGSAPVEPAAAPVNPAGNVAGNTTVNTTANIAGKAVVGTAKVGGKVVAGAATVAGKIVEDKIDDTFDTLDKVVDGDIGGLAKKQIKNKLQSEAFSAVGSIIKK